MTSYYTYLISTLPGLQFGMRPPFSFEKFIAYCQEFIPDSDIKILKNLSITGEYGEVTNPTLRKWQAFDMALRNELVKIRASQRRIDPSMYLRIIKYEDTFHLHDIAMRACRCPSILEAERILDEERWRALDEFSFGHYFDIDFLIIYGLKLLILERWERINTLDKERALKEILSHARSLG